VLYPGFTALDVFGPLDVLNTTALQNGTIDLAIIAKTLDPVSTAATAMNTTGSNIGEPVVPTHTFDTAPTDLEVLLVPGGAGSRAPNLGSAYDYIRATYPSLKYIISVCTGATLLARAGVLDGRRATTNKHAWAWATSTGPNTTWVPTARWVVDGNVWTTSGVAAGSCHSAYLIVALAHSQAGTDGFYAFITSIYGDDFAQYIANVEEYERHTNASADPFGAIWNVPGAAPVPLPGTQCCTCCL
jgi:putative intracellular protease/amidase